MRHLYLFKVLGTENVCLLTELEEMEIESKPFSQLHKAIYLVKQIMIKTEYGTCNRAVFRKLHLH